MSVVSDGPGTGPPTRLPLGHFLVGLGFLLAAATVRLGGAPGGRTRLAWTHLFVVGRVCVTIMGAMTQFVTVRSGVDLHSRRLATAQLLLVAPGAGGWPPGSSSGNRRGSPSRGWPSSSGSGCSSPTSGRYGRS